MDIQNQRVCFSPPLPLAMYRELAVHLRQVNLVETTLYPQDAASFNYDDSQVGAIAISFPSSSYDLVRKILSNYGTWQII